MASIPQRQGSLFGFSNLMGYKPIAGNVLLGQKNLIVEGAASAGSRLCMIRGINRMKFFASIIFTLEISAKRGKVELCSYPNMGKIA